MSTKNYNFILTLMFVFIIGINMYNYLEGDRVPNFSILICGSLAYILLKNNFFNMLISVIYNYRAFWNKYISNKLLVLNNLIRKIQNIILLNIIYLTNFENYKRIFIMKYLINTNFIYLYLYNNNIWLLKVLSNIRLLYNVEVSLYKLYNYFILLNNYISIYLYAKKFNKK